VFGIADRNRRESAKLLAYGNRCMYVATLLHNFLCKSSVKRTLLYTKITIRRARKTASYLCSRISNWNTCHLVSRSDLMAVYFSLWKVLQWKLYRKIIRDVANWARE